MLNEYKDEKYQTYAPETIFDYREDLAINMDISGNLLVCLGLACLYYTLAFVFLKKLVSNISA